MSMRWADSTGSVTHFFVLAVIVDDVFSSLTMGLVVDQEKIVLDGNFLVNFQKVV